jgi:O-antigen ligase
MRSIMPATRPRWFTIAERVSAAVLLAWLFWLPLPFGSNVEMARRPLIAMPLVLCAVAAFVRFGATRYRSSAPDLPRAWRLWTIGGVLLIAVGILQLVPLPMSLLRVISPSSHAIWSDASRIATLAGAAAPSMRPISVDPSATAFEVFRLAALLAAFQTSALLIRSHARRMALAIVISLSALFQAIYGVREAAMGRYAIWGWVNRLIFDRVTGTFVNPNHFAHYVAIALPLALFIAAAAWREAAPPQVHVRRRLVQLFERRFVPFGFAAIGVVGSLAAIVLSQSRGGLLALGAGLLITGAMLPGKRVAKLALASAAAAVLLAALVFFIGQDRALRRFGPREDAQSTLVGRRIAVSAALATWRDFPLLGSGLGTFERVVGIVQREGADRTYHHAHNDYVELGATAGTIGFIAALGLLAVGYITLIRQTFGDESRQLKWKRRAFQAAALGSLTIAFVHALFDFNFYIPANPATLAVILGAAVTVIDHDLRRSGSSYDDSATRR